MTLNRNVTDYHAEIEQAAFEPNNIVPGTGLSPDKMLLARGFSYADAHRARLGRELQADPGQRSRKVEVHSLLQGRRDADPQRHRSGVRAELEGRPARRTRSARPRCTGTSDGDMVRTAYTLRPSDDDWGQAGTLVREVLDDAARDRLVDNIVGHLLNGVQRAGAVAGVRVLAQRRQGPRRPDREGRQRRLTGELTTKEEARSMTDAAALIHRYFDLASQADTESKHT